MDKRLKFNGISIAVILISLMVIISGGWYGYRQLTQPVNKAFDADHAFQDVSYQMSLGPRTVGSQAHTQVVTWMEKQLKEAGWQVEEQSTTSMGHPILNVIAKRGNGKPWIILGAHYDSRLWANNDSDPTKQKDPVPGADDGASGVAVLLELARTLPESLDKQVWLVMIDAEDNGEIPGWDWLLGSKAFVESLQNKPDAAVIIDMIGDSNLNIYMEKNSNRVMNQDIWSAAKELGYSNEFISSYKYNMLDDHTPFLEAGIPAVDIIDFDYPYWHTTQDTLDKVSPQSLKIIGDTLLTWLQEPLRTN
jgi:Zn-dependent M28 family amino/carboxypeptidase